MFLIVIVTFHLLLIIFQCTERTLTNETFLQVAKSSIDIDELEAVKEIVEQNIHKWRSKDSGGIDGKNSFFNNKLCINKHEQKHNNVTKYTMPQKYA